MADKTLEQRLAALEKEVVESKAREAKAVARADALKSELKQTRAAFSDHKATSARAMGALNSMQDLVEARRSDNNPYALGDDETPRERKQRIQKETVHTKDGRAHYFIERPASVSEFGGAPIFYEVGEGGRIISLPCDDDHLPSITWQPVEVVGKDPKTGKLNFGPKGDLAKTKEEPAEPGDEVSDEGSPATNTQMNDQREKRQAAAARLGPGSGGTPAPARPSDQTVG